MKVINVMNSYFSIKSVLILFFSILRNLWFVTSLLIFLTITSLFLLHKASNLSAQLLTAASALNAQKIQHKGEIKRIIAKERAKSRIKQTLIAIPFIGSVVFAAVEINDFKSWQKENPNKTKGDYACETAKASIEVLDDLMDDLPNFTKKNVNKSIKPLIDGCPKGDE